MPKATRFNLVAFSLSDFLFCGAYSCFVCFRHSLFLFTFSFQFLIFFLIFISVSEKNRYHFHKLIYKASQLIQKSEFYDNFIFCNALSGTVFYFLNFICDVNSSSQCGFKLARSDFVLLKNVKCGVLCVLQVSDGVLCFLPVLKLLVLS